MRRLFTIFDLLKIVIPSILAIAGGVAGSNFGTIGLIIGAIIGLLLGGYLGTLLDMFAFRTLCQRLSNTSTDDLHAILGRPEIDLEYPPNFVLLELNRRGEVTSSDLSIIFDMLESDDVERRRCGVAAMTSAFPEIADKAPDYRLDDTTDGCKMKVKVLRDFAEAPRRGLTQ